MWYLLYNLGLILASPVILAVLLAKKRCRRGLPQRLGFLPNGFPGRERPVLWVHAVSLGEAMAVAPLIRELHRRHAEYRIVVSTVTETGREAVEQRLAGVAVHCYAPLDLPWVVSKVVARLNPLAFLFVETELWPNVLRVLAQRGVPAILVNGRLSSRSFGRYRLAQPFMAKVLGNVALCLAQSARDAERLIALGVCPDRVFRTGNIKFDQPEPAGRLGHAALGLVEGEELIVAGSTHQGEEEAVLTGYERMLKEFPRLVLMLAPRHIERAGEVEAMVIQSGFKTVRRSRLSRDGAGGSPGGPRVIVLDTRGELAEIYRLAVLSFVGGTLVPVGGHNLLEPAVWGKPVFFGPHTDHCAEVAALLLKAGGGVLVRDGASLAVEMMRQLKDRSALRIAGTAAQQVVVENRGAIQRSLERIEAHLRGRSRSAACGLC